MNKQERAFAFKISLIMATRMLGLFMIFPIFSVYASEYTSTTPYLIGLSIGIYGLTQALLQIPFGYLSDKYGRKPMLIIGLIIFFIGSVVAAKSTDIIGIVIGRALQGAGAISAVLMAFLADFVSENQHSKANAFVGVQIGIAFMLALLLGPIISSNLSISGLFWVIALLSVIALIIVSTLPNAKPKEQYSLSIANIKKVINIDLLRLDFSVFALHLILTCAFIAIPIFLRENNIVEIKDSWQMYLPIIILSFIGMLPMIILISKYQKIKPIFLSAIALLIISQILFYQIQLTYTLFFILLTLFFIAFNTLEAILPSLIASSASSDKRGLAMGLYATSQFLGAFVGGIVGGWIYNISNLNNVFLLTTFIAIIWWIIILITKQKIPIKQVTEN
ncbi:major facilitator superfamily MFS_1 [Candidatus Ruthia magnifica str. Cm (Calyptogena magnifica)]|uniref:Major facilitator superfamily MFS_1 n=1 Tax=Ruthia magnifica subsp. Calyptogena magnifica TaxID=413404 RepID=A1AWF8_RUTMC|nr:MFS transporter [Candidatus Ruthturnera calyptogenae]ABL02265.1 major facilitator superfamily MFS_1 [Candidatus Ruthia magnifica str. Cm (Calyptogena magnifica)]